MKCNICRKEYSPNCEYRQGRCPYRPAFIDTITMDAYKARYYNLFNTIKTFLKNLRNK